MPSHCGHRHPPKHIGQPRAMPVELLCHLTVTGGTLGALPQIYQPQLPRAWEAHAASTTAVTVLKGPPQKEAVSWELLTCLTSPT